MRATSLLPLVDSGYPRIVSVEYLSSSGWSDAGAGLQVLAALTLLWEVLGTDGRHGTADVHLGIRTVRVTRRLLLVLI